jgi:hypothetical protein
VQNFSALPTANPPAVDSAFLVREPEGTWLISRKPAGIYIRVATTGTRATDWTYAGILPDVFNDANFLLYDNGDSSKNLAFQLSGITTGTTRTLTVPDASGTIARTETFAAPPAIGNTTAAAGSFTTLSASDALTASNATASPPTTLTATKGLQWLLPSSGYAAIAGIYPGSPAISLLTGSVGGMSELARFSLSGIAFNSPLTATPSSGSALTLTGGTVAASAPLIDATQTWNNGAVTFTGLRVNITNTASGASSIPVDFQVGGSSQFRVRRSGGGVDIAGSSSGVRITDYAITGLGGGLDIRSASGSTGLNFDTGVITTVGCSLFDQRSGTTAQEYRLAATHTSATNYQRMTIKSVRQTLSALSGASATTTGTFIPDGAVVVGVTTRVGTLLTGATGYTIGDGTDADRWGDITGTAVGTTSDNRDWTAATIECFTSGGNITLTAKTNNFTAGAIEICVFYLAGEAD